MNCRICGKSLESEPLNVDEDQQAHTACLELEQDRKLDAEIAKDKEAE